MEATGDRRHQILKSMSGAKEQEVEKEVKAVRRHGSVKTSQVCSDCILHSAVFIAGSHSCPEEPFRISLLLCKVHSFPKVATVSQMIEPQIYQDIV